LLLLHLRTIGGLYEGSSVCCPTDRPFFLINAALEVEEGKKADVLSPPREAG
jgi:hypothetical protein